MLLTWAASSLRPSYHSPRIQNTLRTRHKVSCFSYKRYISIYYFKYDFTRKWDLVSCLYVSLVFDLMICDIQAQLICIGDLIFPPETLFRNLDKIPSVYPGACS